ncbi:MAG TPA: ABC-F family ATP-binding cassette domain-containing protein [Candidatus Hydrogenedentes bacterium]|nr:ABC-F family ATP-binding cassette domain-containing protein [Candidatus Hydrogenedentota bacterium]HPG68127.1 ABC-F family ATP-binding cassette domain-containing protein [Candidatus Hydrogenedentota bacterium]
MSAVKPSKVILGVQGVVKSFGAQPILRDVSLTIHEGDRIGLIGTNGSGKSTLLRIMAGLETPDSGLVTSSRFLRIGLLAQECDLDACKTVGEVLDESGQAIRALLKQYECLGDALAEGDARAGREIAERHAALAHELEIAGAWDWEKHVKEIHVSLTLPPLDKPLSVLSGGELRRLDLARTLLQRPSLLLLDEPTNQIDTASVQWIEQFLEAYAGSCILVTHDRYFLDRIVNRIVELDQKRLFSFPGRYEAFLEYKSGILDAERRSVLNRQPLIRRELEWLRRGPKARGTKQKARIQRIDDLVRDKPSATTPALAFAIPEPRPLGKRILEAEHVFHGYNGRHLFLDFSIIMQQGMRVGILGPNGCGKTTLLRVLMGLDEPDRGRVVIGETTQFLYVDQTREAIDPDESILHFVSNGVLHWDVGPRRLYVPAYLETLLFDRDSVDMPMRNLSGGESSRINLARKLLRGGNFLVLDEPTNDLDLATMRVLEEAVLASAGCALIVSHDRYFLNRVCTHLLVFEPEGRIVTIAGNYDDYVLYRERTREVARPVRPVPVEKPRSASPRPQRLSWQERKELDGMEAAILECEGDVERLEAQIASPGFYEQDYRVVQNALAALDAQRRRIDDLYERWALLDGKR